MESEIWESVPPYPYPILGSEIWESVPPYPCPILGSEVFLLWKTFWEFIEKLLGSFMVDFSDIRVGVVSSFMVGLLGWWLKYVRSLAVGEGGRVRFLEYLGEARN